MEILIGIFIMIFWALCIIVPIAAWIHGLILAFRASIILGIICFFLEVPFFIFALVKWFTGVDLADRLAKAVPEVFRV